MPTDLLVLGGTTFDAWSTPETIPFGGEQALKVHKLPGGSRVVDVLGPDEMDIRFDGIFWNAQANAQAANLNVMRIAGSQIALTYGGNAYQVIIKSCILTINKYPQYYRYSITCLVCSTPSTTSALGNLASSLTSMVGADVANALSAIGF